MTSPLKNVTVRDMEAIAMLIIESDTPRLDARQIYENALTATRHVEQTRKQHPEFGTGLMSAWLAWADDRKYETQHLPSMNNPSFRKAFALAVDEFERLCEIQEVAA
jgi:hypothetical protein